MLERDLRLHFWAFAAWALLACWPFIPSIADAKTPGKGPILVVGDSLSAAHNIPVQSGWVSLLEQRLKKQLKAPPVLVNASISGETSSGALTRLPGLLGRHRPSIVIIELGGNDALRGLAPTHLRENFDRMIRLSRQAGAQVVLLGIDVPPNYGPVYRARLRDVYRKLAEQYRLALVPFMLEGVALQPRLMQRDGLHPTAAAQPRLLDNVWSKLKGELEN